MLNYELEEFCQNWLVKAAEINDRTLSGLFDKFFTLYVVYNRLYIEAAFRMATDGSGKNLENADSFPDSEAAKNYVVQFLKCTYIDQQLKSDPKYITAIEALKDILKEKRFHIKIHQVKGTPMPEKDEDLLKRLESQSTDTRIKAITDFIYSIRCNVFHAQKGYHPNQRDVLEPVITLLEKFITMLMQKLSK